MPLLFRLLFVLLCTEQYFAHSEEQRKKQQRKQWKQEEREERQRKENERLEMEENARRERERHDAYEHAQKLEKLEQERRRVSTALGRTVPLIRVPLAHTRGCNRKRRQL